MINYFKRLGKWLFESYPIMIVIIPSISVFLFRKSLGVELIELCGGVLQFIGALYGLIVFIKVRKAFSFPSLYELFIIWLKRFPRWRKDVTVMGGITLAPIAILNAKASVWSPDDPHLKIEERLERMIRNQEALMKSLELIDETISKQNIAFLTRFEKIEGNLSSEISQVKTKLESIHMEDFIWALSGLLFILVGILFSSFAKYIV